MDAPTGTIAVTENSNAVVGTGTNFDSEWEGKYLKVEDNNKWYEIDEVTSATALTLKLNYRGPTASGQYYIIGADQQFKRQDIIGKEEHPRGGFNI